MKRKLLFLLFMLCVLPFLRLQAQTYTTTANGKKWDYTLNGSNATITSAVNTDGTTASGALNVPGSVDGHPVTAIGDYAFFLNTLLTSLTVPNSLTTIGEDAFNGCTGLTSLSLPNVTTIGNIAFNGCTGLTGSLSLPKATIIGINAFNGCSGLNGTLSLPQATTIGNGAFSGCNHLIGSLSLPNATIIGNNAFIGCHNLTGTLSMPNVTTIGASAFRGCSGFTGSLSLPNVTTIGNNAFQNCTGFNGTLSLPNVTSIGNYAFQSCSGFTGSLSLPKATTIGIAAFIYCSGFTGTLSLPEATILNESAFNTCTGLTGFSLPKATVLKDWAFNNCTGLTGVHTLPEATIIGQAAFFNCTGITALSLPKVTTIGNTAFQNCSGLTGTWILPKTLTRIGSLAFMSCNNLKAVIFENGTTLTHIIGYQHFLLCDNLQYIDMRGVTLPPGFIVSRNSSGLSLFMSVQPYTMIYLPATAPAAEANQENFVIGGICNKFVVYDTHSAYTMPHITNPGCNYPIQQSFTAATAEYKGRNIAGNRYSSLYLPYPATLPNGMRAYILQAKTVHGGITHFRFVSVGDGGTQLQANKPYLIRVTDGSTSKQFGMDVGVQVPVTPGIASTEVQDANGQGFYFGGTTENIDNATAAGMKAYNLINNEWRPIRTDNPNGYIHSFRAYMRTTGAAPAKGFAIVLDDEDSTTDIDTAVENEVEQGNSPIYTLDGKLMGTDIDALPSGEIYVKNGKKFYKF